MAKTPVHHRKRAAIYTRISKDRDGESLGVDRQEEACRKLADLLGLDVIEPPYSDNDISAFSGKTRPDFERLVEDITAGDVDVVLCQHTDRLYRTLADLVRIFDAGPTLLIKTIQGGDIDLSNSTGKMLATILGSVQVQESEHHSERRKFAYRTGRPPPTAPSGTAWMASRTSRKPPQSAPPSLTCWKARASSK
jgi:site-specific DNA recombinase